MTKTMELLINKIADNLKKMSVSEFRNIQTPNTKKNTFVRMSKGDVFIEGEGWNKINSLINTYVGEYSDKTNFVSVKIFPLKGVWSESDLLIVEKELQEIVKFFNL